MSVDPIAQERAWLLDLIGMADNPDVPISDLRAMTGAGADVDQSARAATGGDGGGAGEPGIPAHTHPQYALTGHTHPLPTEYEDMPSLVVIFENGLI